MMTISDIDARRAELTKYRSTMTYREYYEAWEQLLRDEASLLTGQPTQKQGGHHEYTTHN